MPLITPLYYNNINLQLSYPAESLDTLSNSIQMVDLSGVARSLALDLNDLVDEVSGRLQQLLEVSIRGLLALGSGDEQSTLSLDSLINQSNLK